MALSDRFDRDALSVLPTKQAAMATAAIFDTNQYRKPEEIVAGIACAAILVFQKYGISVQDALQFAENMMRAHDENGKSDFDGLREYINSDVFAHNSEFNF